MLSAEKVYKTYGNVEVLKGVSLDLSPGVVTALVGSSGAGKTTLLQIMGTLDQPTQGEIKYENRSISKMSSKQLAHFRNTHLGFVFQFHHLMAEFSAVENVSMPAYIKGVSQAKAHRKAQELLELLGLGHRLKHKPYELSGGEQQRVAVARALMNEPRYILADEPTGNLDTQNSNELMQLFFNLAEENKIGFLVATHNETFAQSAHRCIRIQDGQILSVEQS
jgi:lipoprotein-releasing system ATP-binding protein